MLSELLHDRPAPAGGEARVVPALVHYAGRARALGAFPEQFELAYVEGDPEPYVSRQVMSRSDLVRDHDLVEALLGFLAKEKKILLMERRVMERGT